MSGSLENIEPYQMNHLSPERRHELQSKGGKAAAAARRRRKSLQEAADLFLAMPVKDSEICRKLKENGLKKEDIDYQMAIIVELALRAARGDIKAAKILFDLVGVDVSQQNRSVQIIDDM